MERAKASIIDCLDDCIDRWYNKLVNDKYILRKWKNKNISKVKIFVRIKNFQTIQLVNTVEMLFSKRRHYIL